MPLVKCPECGGNVSDQALTCPHCGVELGQCPECGNIIKYQSDRCPNCGIDLNWDKPTNIDQYDYPNEESFFERNRVAIIVVIFFVALGVLGAFLTRSKIPKDDALAIDSTMVDTACCDSACVDSADVMPSGNNTEDNFDKQEEISDNIDEDVNSESSMTPENREQLKALMSQYGRAHDNLKLAMAQFTTNYYRGYQVVSCYGDMIQCLAEMRDAAKRMSYIDSKCSELCFLQIEAYEKSIDEVRRKTGGYR